MSLDRRKLSKVKDRADGGFDAQCPVCFACGKDSKGDNLRAWPDESYKCIVGCDTKEIFALAGNRDSLPTSGPCLARPIPKPKRLDLLARIKRDYPACVYDLWDSSPILCDESLDNAKAFLRLFPAAAVLWIAPDVYRTGKPEHAVYFRTRAEWEAETFIAPGMRIAPCSFKAGSHSRGADSVAEHLFVVIESDEIGEGKLYASKDEFCSLIRWLREACGWHLSAVVDSGRRSLHAWFSHPGAIDMEQLAEHAAALGLDRKFSEPSQPWRLPGVKREGSETRQHIVYMEGGL